MSRPRADANLINGYVMLCWCTDNTLESSVAGEKGKNSSRRNNETSRRILAVSGTQHGSVGGCLLYTSPSPRDLSTSRMPSSA